MTLRIFNACLIAGWLLMVLGVSLVSIPAALVVGGLVLVGLTLLLAFRAGVIPNRSEKG
jgi:hypothetical protein